MTDRARERAVSSLIQPTSPEERAQTQVETTSAVRLKQNGKSFAVRGLYDHLQGRSVIPVPRLRTQSAIKRILWPCRL